MDQSSVEMKFARALSHTDELEAGVAAFLNSEPFKVEQREDPSGDLVTVVRVQQNPPVELSVVLGDAIHNARSALDHLAHVLIEENGRAPDDHTYFPIADSPVGYGEKVRSGLRGASTSSKAAVKAAQPWRGGDDQLWQLHRLDIVDKHRLLVPVGAAQRGIALEFSFEGSPELGLDPQPAIPIHLNAADSQYPLQDGAEVFRIMKAARDSEVGSPFKTQHAITFELAFGEGVVMPGAPIIPTVRQLIEHAESVARSILSPT